MPGRNASRMHEVRWTRWRFGLASRLVTSRRPGGLSVCLLPTCLYLYVEPRGRLQWAREGDSPDAPGAPVLVRATAWLSFAGGSARHALAARSGGLRRARLPADPPRRAGNPSAWRRRPWPGFGAGAGALALRLVPLGVRLLACATRGPARRRRARASQRSRERVHARRGVALGWAVGTVPRLRASLAGHGARLGGAAPGDGVRCGRVSCTRLLLGQCARAAKTEPREGPMRKRTSSSSLLAEIAAASLAALAAVRARGPRRRVGPAVATSGRDGRRRLLHGCRCHPRRDRRRPARRRERGRRGRLSAAKYGVSMHPSSAWSTTHDKLEVADVDPATETRDPRRPRPRSARRARRAHGALPRDLRPRRSALREQAVAPASASAPRPRGATPAGRGSPSRSSTPASPASTRAPSRAGRDLAGTRCEGGWNFVDDTPRRPTTTGHGTHVAGTIAQTTEQRRGRGGPGVLRHAHAHQGPEQAGLRERGQRRRGHPLRRRRRRADHQPVARGPDQEPHPRRTRSTTPSPRAWSSSLRRATAGKSVGWPAAYPGVVAVSATDDKDKIAWFSSRGPEVAIAAPGVAVTQQTVCNGGKDKCEIFGTFNGTSMASPHVAGVAAMIESAGRDRCRRGARGALPPRARTPSGATRSSTARASSTRGRRRRTSSGGTSRLRGLALLGLAWLVGRRIRKRGGKVGRARRGCLARGAARAASGSCPFVPVLGLRAHAGKLHELRRAGDAAARRVGPASSPARACTAGCSWRAPCPRSRLTTLGFASRRMRPFIGGVALGNGGAPRSDGVVGRRGVRRSGRCWRGLWTVANALVCLWIARIALDAKRA